MPDALAKESGFHSVRGNTWLRPYRLKPADMLTKIIVIAADLNKAFYDKSEEDFEQEYYESM